MNHPSIQSSSLSTLVRNYLCRHISSDYVGYFGDNSDGVIEFVGKTSTAGGLFEAGYYYGDTKPKPIIGISPMMGCPAACNFCELGATKFIRALTAEEMFEQVMMALAFTERVVPIDRQHKVNIAKSGEPLLNPNLVSGLSLIGNLGFSFKISTVFPKGPAAKQILTHLAEFAHDYPQPVQLQVSLISTSDSFRLQAAGGVAASITEIRQGAELWANLNPSPKGRKVNVSLILTEDTPADPLELKGVLPPELVNVRLRDYIPTAHGQESGLPILTQQRYDELVAQFNGCGYTVSKWARPTNTEHKFRLVSNSTLTHYLQQTREW